MAVQQLMAPLPQILLEGGCMIKFEAIDPTTGLAVAGVTAKAIAIYGTTGTSADVQELVSGPFMLVPGPDA